MLESKIKTYHVNELRESESHFNSQSVRVVTNRSDERVIAVDEIIVKSFSIVISTNRAQEQQKHKHKQTPLHVTNHHMSRTSINNQEKQTKKNNNKKVTVIFFQSHSSCYFDLHTLHMMQTPTKTLERETLYREFNGNYFNLHSQFQFYG